MAEKSPSLDAMPLDEPPRVGWLARVLGLSQNTLGLCFSERRLLLFIIDLVVISAALLLALWARSAIFREMEPVGYFPLRPIWWIVLAAVWAPLALVFDCYNLKLASEPGRGIVYAMGCALFVSVIYLIIPIYSAPLTRSRLAWFLFAFGAVAGEGLWRLGYARFFRQAPFARRVLIVGAGGAGRALAEEVARLGEYAGVDLVGFMDDNAALRGEEVVAGYRVLGDSHDLAALARRLRVVDIVVAITNTQVIRAELMQALIECWINGMSVLPMPVYYEQVVGAIPAEHLGQNLFALASTQVGVGLRLWLVFRRLADLVAGALGLLVTGALFPFIALAIVLESPGPVFYRQERVGLGGRRFWLTKFRSMIPNAEQQGAVWAAKDDARKTRVGAFLRRTRLDELPQFWNILNGTMTLIGPRPERPEFVEQLTGSLPYFPIRHSVTPGLTGWAQVRFRYASSVDDSLQKLCYDLYYIKRRGPVLDALICLYTLRVLLRMEGS
jgi:exopolysaccharide biosynthesis polyprenyl glycosylphosphotransferase